MTTFPGTLLAAFAFTAALTAQTPEPQLASLTIEGRVPLANVLPNPAAAAIPSDLIQAVQSGALEPRLRIQLDAAARRFRVYGIVAAPNTPFLPDQVPERGVGMDFDLSIERLYWNQTKSGDDGKPQLTLFAAGRRTTIRKGLGDPGDFCVLEVILDGEAPHQSRLLSVSMGPLVAVASDIRGAIRLAPAKPR